MSKYRVIAIEKKTGQSVAADLRPSWNSASVYRSLWRNRSRDDRENFEYLIRREDGAIPFSWVKKPLFLLVIAAAVTFLSVYLRGEVVEVEGRIVEYKQMDDGHGHWDIDFSFIESTGNKFSMSLDRYKSIPLYFDQDVKLTYNKSWGDIIDITPLPKDKLEPSIELGDNNGY